MRYLANNEQLIERLSQSNVMRRAAQMTVYFSLKWKDIGQGSLENLKHSSGAKYLDYKNIQRFVRRFTNEIKDGVQELKKNKP